MNNLLLLVNAFAVEAGPFPSDAGTLVLLSPFGGHLASKHKRSIFLLQC